MANELGQVKKVEIESLIAYFEKEEIQDWDQDDPDPTTQELASIALFLMDQAAVPYLIRALADKNPQVHRWSISTLGAIEDKQATEPLLRLLEQADEERGNHLNALFALSSIKDPRS